MSLLLTTEAGELEVGLTVQDRVVFVGLRYEVGEGQHGGADGHQQPADSNDAGTVNPVPKVAQEDDEHAVTDLRDRETKGFTL